MAALPGRRIAGGVIAIIIRQSHQVSAFVDVGMGIDMRRSRPDVHKVIRSPHVGVADWRSHGRLILFGEIPRAISPIKISLIEGFYRGISGIIRAAIDEDHRIDEAIGITVETAAIVAASGLVVTEGGTQHRCRAIGGVAIERIEGAWGIGTHVFRGDRITEIKGPVGAFGIKGRHRFVVTGRAAAGPIKDRYKILESGSGEGITG